MTTATATVTTMTTTTTTVTVTTMTTVTATTSTTPTSMWNRSSTARRTWSTCSKTTGTTSTTRISSTLQDDLVHVHDQLTHRHGSEHTHGAAGATVAPSSAALDRGTTAVKAPVTAATPAQTHSHTDGHTHTHGDAHAHEDGHTHTHEDAHAHEDGHTHVHDGGHTHEGEAPERTFSRMGLVGMGVAGGLVPSPSALVILLSAIALGRTAFGIVLVLAYGLGMAVTLTAAGVLLVYVRDRWVNRFTSGVSRIGDRWRRILPYATAGLIIIVGTGLALRSLWSL